MERGGVNWVCSGSFSRMRKSNTAMMLTRRPNTFINCLFFSPRASWKTVALALIDFGNDP